MTWSNTPIDGQQSVAANKTPINSAFTYIANKMVSDHTWGSNDITDGYHSQVSMPKTEAGGNPADPAFVVGSNTDGIYYVKDKTATEAPVVQNAEPFHISNDGTNDQILQLGFRALAVWDGNGTSLISQANVKYSHNISSQPTGIVRNGTGRFTITFNTPLPSENYVIFGGAIRNTGSIGDNPMIYYVPSDGTVTDVKSKTFCKVNFRNPDGSHHDALHYWVAFVGG